MNTVGRLATGGSAVEFDQLASAARRAFAADAVLIALDRGGAWSGRPVPVPTATADGYDEFALDALRGDIGLLDGEIDFGTDEPHLLDFTAARDGAGARIAAGHGFAAGLAAAVTLEGMRIGSVHALRCEPGPFPNAMMITTYARQIAISLAQGELGECPEAISSVGALLDALQPAARSQEALSRLINDEIAPLFGAGGAGVMRWESGDQMLRLLPGAFGVDRELRRLTQVRVEDPRSNAARVFATDRPYICNEALDDPGVLAEQTRALGIERVMTLPLKVGGRRIGVIHFTNGPKEFEVDDLAPANAVLPRVAAAVELALDLGDLRRERRIESSLSAAAVSFVSNAAEDDLLAATLEDVGGALEVDALALVPVAGDPLSWGTAPEALLAECAPHRQVPIGEIEPGAPATTECASCSVPVAIGGDRYATLVAWRGWRQPFATGERRALVRLARMAAFGFAAETSRLEQVERERLRERQRIADDLHDDVAQLLFAAQIDLDAVAARADEQTAAGVAHALGLLVRGDKALRGVIAGITEPAPETLDERFEAVTAGVESVFRRPVALDLHERALGAASELGEGVQEALLRVAREGLVNVAKHAGECNAWVELDLDAQSRLRLKVRDDGVGYATGAAPGHGLNALRRMLADCGGDLQIAAASEGGTELTATITAREQERRRLDVGAAR